jgi:hypothetical protein
MEKKRILETKRGSSGSHFVENILWKNLWTCRETEYGMNYIVTTCIPVCLKKDEACSLAILVLNYNMPRCHKAEDLITNLYRRRNLHSHILLIMETNGFTR